MAGIKYDNMIIEMADGRQISAKAIKDQLDAAGVKSGKAYIVLSQGKAYCEDGKNKTVEVALTVK